MNHENDGHDAIWHWTEYLLTGAKEHLHLAHQLMAKYKTYGGEHYQLVWESIKRRMKEEER